MRTGKFFEASHDAFMHKKAQDLWRGRRMKPPNGGVWRVDARQNLCFLFYFVVLWWLLGGICLDGALVGAWFDVSLPTIVSK
jgi:hypothetical protein